MPKTWSNREIDFIDLHARERTGMPFAGWIIVGMASIGLIIYTVLAINICLHPVQTPINMSAPASQTR